MTTFTQDERERLYAKFPLEQHEYRIGPVSKNGKVRWFVYVRREAIQTLLDDLFFGEWSVDYTKPEYTGNICTVFCTLTIRGVRRSYNGSQAVRGDNDEHAEKGAATDAFKRTASMWGIGLYLQDSPNLTTAGGFLNERNIVTNWDEHNKQQKEVEKRFKTWLNDGVVVADSPPPPTTTTTTRTTAPHWTTVPKRVAGFYAWALDKHALNQDETLNALGVTALEDYKDTDKAAMETIAAYDPLAVEQKPLVDAPAQGSSNYTREDS